MERFIHLRGKEHLPFVLALVGNLETECAHSCPISGLNTHNRNNCQDASDPNVVPVPGFGQDHVRYVMNPVQLTSLTPEFRELFEAIGVPGG